MIKKPSDRNIMLMKNSSDASQPVFARMVVEDGGEGEWLILWVIQ